MPLQKDVNRGIDFRSDTITQPSSELRKLMVNADVGDDVFYDDPTINLLQVEMAKLFGKEKAILVPSGTMANLISIMMHCRQKGDATIIGDMSHINNWERGNIASAGSVFPVTL
jgi:threonine aldolase